MRLRRRGSPPVARRRSGNAAFANRLRGSTPQAHSQPETVVGIQRQDSGRTRNVPGRAGQRQSHRLLNQLRRKTVGLQDFHASSCAPAASRSARKRTRLRYRERHVHATACRLAAALEAGAFAPCAIALEQRRGPVRLHDSGSSITHAGSSGSSGRVSFQPAAPPSHRAGERTASSMLTGVSGSTAARPTGATRNEPQLDAGVSMSGSTRGRATGATDAH